MDAAISLVVAYRDFDMPQDAYSMLEKLDKEGETHNHFDRHCQVIHLRALLQLDEGNLDEAIDTLQGLLIQTDRECYSWPLMWVMIDLALLLRKRNKDGDKEQAAINFNNILVDSRHEDATDVGPEPDPDPPRLLRLAEEALLLVRNRELPKLKELFETEKVRWYRPKDIFVIFGAPAADTAWMRGPFERAW